MSGYFVRSLCLAFGLMGLSSLASAVEFRGAEYEVYLGEVNGDSAQDVYLAGKEQFILLHGDIATPIVIPAETSYELLTNPAIVGSDGGWGVYYHLAFDAPVAVQPPYASEELYLMGYTLGIEDEDYYVGDFDGDGAQDILLANQGQMADWTVNLDSGQPTIESDDLGRFVLIRGGEDVFSEVAVAAVTENLIDGGNIFDQNFTVQDTNSDGRDELVVLGGEYIADANFSLSTDGNSLILEYEGNDLPINIAEPSINGVSTGSFRVSESGAATYNVPLSLPAGTAGVAPQLSLNYSSQGGSSLLGWGWNLNGVSSISRCRKTLFQDGETSPLQWDASIFCYNGQRLYQVSGNEDSRYYRTAIETHEVIKSYGTESNPSYFTVLGRDGSLSTFGGTVDSHQAGGDDATLAWSISRFEDSAKNRVEYNYDQNNGSDFRVSNIQYAFGDGEYPHSEIEFNYGDRLDISGGYIAGKQVLTTKRLNNIIVKNYEPSSPGMTERQEVRKYSLHYLRKNITDKHDRSYISAIQECVQNNCLPAITFDWSKDISLEFGEPELTSELTYGDNELINTVPMDINGDGYMDMVWVEDGENDGDHFYKVRYMLFNSATQLFEKKDFVGSSGSCPRTGHDGVYERPRRILLCESPRGGIEKRVFFQGMDYNGDGRQDLAMYRNDKSAWYIHLSTLVESTGEWRLSGTAEVVFDPGSKQSTIMDVNSDGMPDIVTPGKIYYLSKKNGASASDASSYTYLQSEGAVVENVQWIWDTPRLHDPSGIESIINGNSYQYDFAGIGDFNGDGSGDLILVDRMFGAGGGWGNPGVGGVSDHYYIALREGNAFRVVERVGTAVGARYTPGYRNPPLIGHSVADVNGDGYSDIFKEKSHLDENYDYVFQLNTGNGLTAPVDILDFAHANSLREGRTISLQDINGDGYLDAISTAKGTSTIRYRPWGNAEKAFDETPQDIWGDKLSGDDSRTLIYDTSGDGRLDLIFFSGDRFGVSKNIAEGPQGVITEITNGFGAETKIEYEPLHSSTHYRGIQYASTSQTTGAVDTDQFYSILNDPFADLAGDERFDQVTAPVLEYLSPVHVVTAIEGNSPAGNETIGMAGNVDTNNRSRLEYYYYLGRIQAGGLGFLGFKALMTEEPQTEVRTTSFYRQDWPFIGSPDRTEKRLPSGDIMSLTQSEWGIVGWDSAWESSLASSTSGTSVLPSIQPYLKKHDDVRYKLVTDENNPSQVVAYELASGNSNCVYGIKCAVNLSNDAVIQTLSTINEYDAYGNADKVTKVTSGGGLSQTAIIENTFPTDVSITLHGESRTYAQLGRITHTKSETTRAGGSTVTREAAYSYYGDDNQNSAAVGLMKSEVIEPNNDDLKVTITYSYDLRGNKVRADTVGRNHQYHFDGTISSQTNQTRSQTFVMDEDAYRYINTTMTVLDGGEYTKEVVTERNVYGSPAKIESAVSDFVTTIEYDSFNREVLSADNAGAWVRTEYLKCSNISGCPIGTSYAVRKSTAGGGSSVSYYDVIGRVTRETARSFGGSDVYVDTEYNSKGQKIRVSEPYFFGETKYWKHYTTDTLGRPVQIRLPDGATQTKSYNGYSVTTTNALGVSRTENKNGLGELIRVDEALGASIVYDYDGKGNLEFIRSMPAAGDPNQSEIVTQLSYNDQGRKISMDDPDKGLWLYEYNAFGELVWQKDANGQVVTQRYDASGRLDKRIDYTSNGEIEGDTTWYFDGYTDTSPNEKVVSNALMQVSAIVMLSDSGQACDANSAIQCVYPSYDSFGRSVATEVRNKSYGSNLASYITEISYDRIGRVSTVTDALNAVVISNRSGDARYLDNSIQSGIENHYNSSGFLESVSDLQTGKTVYHKLSENARGQTLTSLRGNNVTSRNTYDPLTGQLVKQEGDILDIYKVQYIEYDWDLVGNLSSRFNDSLRVNSSGRRNKQESFCYDSLNRLIKTNANTRSTANCETLTSEAQDLRYDSRGNILFKQDVGAYTYDINLAGPHAVTSTSAGDSYSYDNNGNMEDSFGAVRRKLSYATYDKPIQIVKGDPNSPDHTTNFRYGIERSRFWREDIDKNGAVTTTEYLGGVERIKKSSDPGKITWKRYLGKTAIFELTTDENNVLLSGAENYKESYIYNDHLGSLDVITDAAGTVTQSLSFDEWGNRRDADTWEKLDLSDVSVLASVKSITTRGYTGHEMLDEVGFIHMNGRIYDPRIARFAQADPIVQAATNTQSLNRYSYVWNNPLNSVDPSGFINTNVWQREFRTVVSAVVIAASSAICGPCSIVVAAMVAKMNGASDRGVFKAALVQAISYGAGVGMENAGMSATFSVVAQGVVGGVVSVVGGGKFGHGFFSGVAKGRFGPLGGIVAAGVVSKRTGGKFESGVYSAAFHYAISWAVGKIFEEKDTGSIHDQDVPDTPEVVIEEDIEVPLPSTRNEETRPPEYDLVDAPGVSEEQYKQQLLRINEGDRIRDLKAEEQRYEKAMAPWKKKARTGLEGTFKKGVGKVKPKRKNKALEELEDRIADKFTGGDFFGDVSEAVLGPLFTTSPGAIEIRTRYLQNVKRINQKYDSQKDEILRSFE